MVDLHTLFETIDRLELDELEAAQQYIAERRRALANKPHNRPLTAREVLHLPEAERKHILETAAAQAEADYRNNPDLTDFEAFDR